MDAHRYTLEQLDGMSHDEQISNIISRMGNDPDYSVERMNYIKQFGLTPTRVLLPVKSCVSFTHVQYTKVYMTAAHAVEFKLRFYNFDLNNLENVVSL